MYPTKIYSEEWEVGSKLVEFGVSKEELFHVVQKVVAARADATDDDPLSAEGLFAYIYGTRNLRALFRRKGWVTDRQENVEAVRNPETGHRIVFQNVDLAAAPRRSPRAISSKGPGSRRIIDGAQGFLFSADEIGEVVSEITPHENDAVWYFCVSVNGDKVCAELSLPVSVQDGNFSGFYERIFVVSDGDWEGDGFRAKDLPDADAIEFEPEVSRK